MRYGTTLSLICATNMCTYVCVYMCMRMQYRCHTHTTLVAKIIDSYSYVCNYYHIHILPPFPIHIPYTHSPPTIPAGSFQWAFDSSAPPPPLASCELGHVDWHRCCVWYGYGYGRDRFVGERGEMRAFPVPRWFWRRSPGCVHLEDSLCVYISVCVCVYVCMCVSISIIFMLHLSGCLYANHIIKTKINQLISPPDQPTDLYHRSS